MHVAFRNWHALPNCSSSRFMFREFVFLKIFAGLIGNKIMLLIKYDKYLIAEKVKSLKNAAYSGPDLPIGYIGLSLGPQDPREAASKLWYT